MDETVRELLVLIDQRIALLEGRISKLELNAIQHETDHKLATIQNRNDRELDAIRRETDQKLKTIREKYK